MSDGRSSGYLMAGQPAELQRLQLQSRVWEPAGRELLARLPPGAGLRALDAGCGAMGWLRLLSEWVGPRGHVTGTDIDDGLMAHARAFAQVESLDNVEIVRDDLFASALPPGSFELVHARFQIAPLGRGAEQVASYLRLLRRGGILVLEDPDLASWRVEPEAPAVQRLIGWIAEAFRAAAGDFNAGRSLPALCRAAGLDPHLRAHVVALEPGHPYLKLPLQFAASLRTRLEAVTGAQALDETVAAAERELAAPGAWGTTFTLIQVWAEKPGG